MPTRTFTVTELADYGVPPSDPRDIEYDPDLLADEFVTTLKYTATRRCIFRADDDRLYAVEYEAPIDMGDFEVGAGMPDNHGWHGDTVTATEVEERPVIVARWYPVTDEPGTNEPRTGALESLAEIWFTEAGAREDVAREAAAAWIVQHADEVAELYDAYLATADDQQ
ncbi:hypothetical protein ABZ905_08770 [Streptomyces parvus]|uniref:hypothetical protein n=1 Tax=Streptomyces parvus TaxID=66428 RepID=UPI0033D788E3